MQLMFISKKTEKRSNRKDKDWKIVKQELNRYTPSNTYLQQMGSVGNINNTNARLADSEQDQSPEEIINQINSNLPF